MKECKNVTENVVMLHHSKLIDSDENPFKVIFDGKMYELIESVKENGILTPIIVRQTKMFLRYYQVKDV